MDWISNITNHLRLNAQDPKHKRVLDDLDSSNTQALCNWFKGRNKEWYATLSEKESETFANQVTSPESVCYIGYAKLHGKPILKLDDYSKLARYMSDTW
jgi:hypothetical protein